MTKRGTWLEQWERVQRSYTRIKQLTEGITPTKKGSPEFNFKDEFCAFFIFCYHLKDWIDNDKTLSLPNKLADKFVYKSENECLQMCGDICNGIKHLELTDPKREPPAKFEKDARVSRRIEDGKYVSIKANLFISTDKGKHNAFDLATECVEKWKEFIDENIGREEIEA